jgi:branched-chain amino acid transport system ATP-binding protein
MMAERERMLELTDITMQFGGVVAVNNLSMHIDRGEIVALIGPNGAGKTTAFNCVTGVYKPTNGQVRYRGGLIVSNHPTGKMKNMYAGVNADKYQEVVEHTPDKITKLGVARTFQNIRLFSTETVLQNVMVGCHVRRSAKWWMAPIGLPSFTREEKAIRERSMELLASLRLDSVADEVSSSLPYGAQRRLEIARALATRPKFLLLDEPAAGMNPQETQELMGFIREIRDRFDVTILLIEHDMKVVMGVCEYIWVLDYGEKIAEGSPEVIQSDRRVIAAYLGEEFVHHAEN